MKIEKPSWNVSWFIYDKWLTRWLIWFVDLWDCINMYMCCNYDHDEPKLQRKIELHFCLWVQKNCTRRIIRCWCIWMHRMARRSGSFHGGAFQAKTTLQEIEVNVRPAIEWCEHRNFSCREIANWPWWTCTRRMDRHSKDEWRMLRQSISWREVARRLV